MPSIVDRRPSVDASDSQPSKRLKTAHETDPADGAFVNNVFDKTSVAQLHTEYLASQPYKHSVLSELFEAELLQSVQNEITRELTFTEKETDIYKVRTFVCDSTT